MSHRAFAACSFAIAVIAVGFVGCSSPAGSSTLIPTGVWGGSQASMTVTMSGAHLEFPCATGDITQAMVVDGSGNFTVNGTYVSQAGPIQDVSQTAHYTGRVENQTMTLSADVAGQTVGPFVLTFRADASFVRCL